MRSSSGENGTESAPANAKFGEKLGENAEQVAKYAPGLRKIKVKTLKFCKRYFSIQFAPGLFRYYKTTFSS